MESENSKLSDKALQTQFTENSGNPIPFGNEFIIQMDKINLAHGKIIFEFIHSNPGLINGFALKVDKGCIVLSDGSNVSKLYTWNLSENSPTGSYEIISKTGVVKVWNIYQVNRKELTQADYWTNNSGMIVKDIDKDKRKYLCSNGIGEFKPDDLVFSLSWNKE